MKFRDITEKKDPRSFISLKDKESVQGIFRGEPHESHVHWINRTRLVCSGGSSCEGCKAGDKPKFRFRLNFIVKEKDAYLAKIWEGGWNVFKKLKNLNEGDYPLERTILKITRDGEELHTTYDIQPIKNGEVSAELDKKLSEIPLNPLGELEETPDTSDIPF